METINLAGLVSIKSLYILKKIVSFVDLVKKMNIIKYNKKFQKNLVSILIIIKLKVESV